MRVVLAAFAGIACSSVQAASAGGCVSDAAGGCVSDASDEDEHSLLALRRMSAQQHELKESAEPKTMTEAPPKICCKALTASCMACSKGVTVEEFCKTNPGKYSGRR